VTSLDAIAAIAFHIRNELRDIRRAPDTQAATGAATMTSPTSNWPSPARTPGGYQHGASNDRDAAPCGRNAEQRDRVAPEVHFARWLPTSAHPAATADGRQS
jgi:hypothetical protein